MAMSTDQYLSGHDRVGPQTASPGRWQMPSLHCAHWGSFALPGMPLWKEKMHNLLPLLDSGLALDLDLIQSHIEFTLKRATKGNFPESHTCTLHQENPSYYSGTGPE